MMRRNPEVSLFVQCLVDALYPEVAEAMVRIFRKLDIPMTCPADQTCCGQPAFNSGYWNEAKAAATRFISVFEHADQIVCPSGSCVNMVRNHYPELFADDGKWLHRARAMGEKTFELTEYLVDVLGVEDLGARYEGRVTYHDSCHLLRGIGVSEQPRKLIRNVRGAGFAEMDESDRCCGFGGAFSVRYPEISSAILEDKIRHIVDSRADVVVGCDMGCLMNIQGMLKRENIPVRTLHIAQLLAG